MGMGWNMLEIDLQKVILKALRVDQSAVLQDASLG